MGILIYRVMFKAKYRIMPTDSGWWRVEIKRWYSLFYFNINDWALFANIEEAKKFIESHRNPIIL